MCDGKILACTTTGGREFCGGRRAIPKPVRGEDDPFGRYAGALGAFDTKEDVTAWLRDLRSDEDDE